MDGNDKQPKRRKGKDYRWLSIKRNYFRGRNECLDSLRQLTGHIDWQRTKGPRSQSFA